MPYDDEGDHEVGYGKPPRNSRFVKGQSGNPRGRPPGAKLMERELDSVRRRPIANLRLGHPGKLPVASTHLSTSG